MFLVRRSAASSGRGSGVFLWKERAENAALRQRLHDSAQIKDDTRIVGNRHGEIALLFDGVALALGMRRSGAKQGGTATYTHDRTLTSAVVSVRSCRYEGCGHGEAGTAFFAGCAAFGVSILRQKDNTPLLPLLLPFPADTVVLESPCPRCPSGKSCVSVRSWVYEGCI